ncbi:hypothetical protein KM043_006333 [Ampulex compressa]|nr:hypothetical protein KM043_006333 [Ampulex compressa]
MKQGISSVSPIVDPTLHQRSSHLSTSLRSGETQDSDSTLIRVVFVDGMPATIGRVSPSCGCPRDSQIRRERRVK